MNSECSPVTKKPSVRTETDLLATDRAHAATLVLRISEVEVVRADGDIRTAEVEGDIERRVARVAVESVIGVEDRRAGNLAVERVDLRGRPIDDGRARVNDRGRAGHRSL